MKKNKIKIQCWNSPHCSNFFKTIYDEHIQELICKKCRKGVNNGKSRKKL